MKLFIGGFIGLLLSVHGGADPLLKGQVRLASGQLAVGVQVRLFDLSNLHWSVGATTDETGHFALSLQAFSERTALPTDFALGQNYPNPFNPSTIIPYQLPASGHVRLEVFNVLGQRLATLVNAERSAGAHTAQWDGTDSAGRAMGAGVYIYRLSSGGVAESQRMVLVDGQAGIPAAATASEPVRAVEGAVEAAGSVYGLTVSGEGLVAYVDPAFRVGINEADIVVKEHGGSPRMKIATGRLLGDVNNDGKVDSFDALYVLLYSEDSSITLPNNGDISLGDVNGDGQVDRADSVLLATYSLNPSDSSLPPGIGEAVPDLDPSVSGTSEDPDIELSHIYWLQRNRIRRAALDGSNIEDLVLIDWGFDRDLALDVAGDKMYWAEDRIIRRSNLDGTNIENVVMAGDINSLALDVAEGKIYWTDTISGNFGRVLRSNLDGTNIEDLVPEVRERFAYEHSDLALDVSRGKIYWKKGGVGILRSNLDGTNIETIVSRDRHKKVGDRGGLALDVAEGKIYWRPDWFYDSKILRSNLDGTNTEDLGIRGTGIDLALDVAGHKIYWTRGERILRSNLDGTNTETILTSDSDSNNIFDIQAIALGPYYEQTNPSEGEEIPVRSRGEARSEVAERGISYSSSSFVTYAQNGDLDVVRLLIEAGLDVNARDENDSGDTALMKAAGQGHLDVVRFLVEQGANLRLVNVLRENALMFAIAGGHLKVVVFLLDNGADLGSGWSLVPLSAPLLPPPSTSTPCFFITREGIIVYCKDSPPDDDSFWEEFVGRTAFDYVGSISPIDPFGWAAVGGDLDILHVLLDVAESKYSTTALKWAAFMGHLDMVRFLVERGAPLNPPVRALDRRDDTALMWAAWGGQLDIVRFLLENGADIHILRPSEFFARETVFGTVYDELIGESVFSIAINGGHADIVRLLLEHWMWEYGADGRGDRSRTVLMYAAAAGDLEMARLLLKNGASVNAQTDIGSTALMFAVSFGHVELVRLLVENGADIYIENENGYTAQSLAAERGYQEVVDFLRSAEDAG